MMPAYKFCKFKPCGKRYDRPEGITNHNWKMMAYCCPDHQAKNKISVRSENAQNIQKLKTESRMKSYYADKRLRAEYNGSKSLSMQRLLNRAW